MPILNRFAKPGRSWPPPRTPEEIRDAVAYAEERDPVGTSVHLGLAMAFCASIALSTAMTSASFVLLVGYTALRTPNLWRAWMPLVASPLAWMWLGWMAWTALQGFRSADTERWRDQLGSFWCVALLPALYPLSGRWRLLVGAFVAGTVLQALLQLAQAFGVLPLPAHAPYRPPGIGSHSGHVTTSAAIAVAVLIAWSREARSAAARIVVVASIGLAGAGVTLGAGRGAILGAAAGVAIAAAGLARRWGIPWSSRWLQGAALAAVLAVASLAVLVASGRGPTSLTFQAQGLERRELAETSSVSKRYLWWMVSADAFREHPVLGIGTGSLFAYSSAHPRLVDVARQANLPVEELATRHPHSVYMLIAAEQGLVGLGWLGSIVVATLVPAWRSTAVRPVACGILAGLAVWLVAAAFECLNLPLRTASMFMMLSVLVALPRGPGVGLDPWPADATRR